MIAYLPTSNACQCTTTYCTCGVRQNYQTTSVSMDNGWIWFTIEAPPRPDRPDRAELNIPKHLLKSWRIWTAWKRVLPMVREMLLPSFELVAVPIRPRMRERRHAFGHSPRRR